MRVNVSLDDILLKDFDAYCEKKRYTRSELLSKLMRDVVYPVHNTPPALREEGTPTKILSIPTENNINREEKNIGWCELHFEKGKEYERKLITWEDENGIPVILKKNACPKCIEKYEGMGRGKVYYL